MQVLVVEDDRSLGAFLKSCLELEHYQVVWVEDGESALLQTEDDSPELVLLDLSLPKLDGIEVLAEMRARHIDASVLVLTGRSDLHIQARCLDIGADDCLLKPFSYCELVARCRALLRRRSQLADPVLRHRDLELHRIEHKVVRAGMTIDLTAKEFALLEFLILHRGECVTRGQLLTEVWKMSSKSVTNVVDVYINYLRRKLDAAAHQNSQPRLIETIRGLGYMLGTPSHKPVARETGRMHVIPSAMYA